MKWMWETNEWNAKPKQEEKKTKSDALTLNSNVTEYLCVYKNTHTHTNRLRLVTNSMEKRIDAEFMRTSTRNML